MRGYHLRVFCPVHVGYGHWSSSSNSSAPVPAVAVDENSLSKNYKFLINKLPNTQKPTLLFQATLSEKHNGPKLATQLL